MKIGDLVRFSQEHCDQPGLGYCTDWVGVLVDTAVNPEGDLKEVHIFWTHNKVDDYLATWWNRLSYFPFEVVNGNR